MVDGDRRHTKSISELWSAFTGRPVLEQNKDHRGYDYKQTIQWLRQDFNQISVEYCPWPRLGSQANPTAIISATF
jgi:hypothetical protein